MINHVRTLLLNVDGSQSPGYTFPGEELVPRDYKAVALPAYLQTIRGALFSTDPDRLLLNYRLAQYMNILHSTPLETDVLAFDNRVTYLPAGNKLFLHYRQPYVQKQVIGATKTFYLMGDPYSVVDRDKLYQEWMVSVTDGSNVTIQRLSVPVSTQVIGYTVSGNLSSILPLTGSNFSFRFESGVGSKWHIKILAKPKDDLGVVVENLKLVDGETIRDNLFGKPSTGVYATYEQIWNEHDELAYRLGAVLLATANRIDEVKKKGV